MIFPSLRWGDREEAPGHGYEILGGPTNGTYAELIAVPAENLYPKPARLSWHEAGAFPLAGLTAYRALFSRAGLRAERDGARARRRQRRLDLRRLARAPGRGASSRHLVER